jgi:tRNA-binding EMAP/Myf-like protein
MIIMVNFVYQPHSLGEILAIYLQPLLPATSHQRYGKVVMVYHQDSLIGINIEDPHQYLPGLRQGIQRTFPIEWMKELNHLFLSHQISYRLPGFESGFQVGEITQVEPHPEADALFVCQVRLGEKVIQVVTNSTKVKPLCRVVVALPGTILNDGQSIQEGAMLKVLSQGMFCSQKTLGIIPETQVGVYILDNTLRIGKDFYGT